MFQLIDNKSIILWARTTNATLQMAKNDSAKVDEIIARTEDWAQPILSELRSIVLDCGLQEAVKWGAPTYVHHGNVVGLVALKNYVSLWFFEGAQLSDPDNVLIASSEKTKALRQWRFTTVSEIDRKKVKQYVNEAALNMEKGIKTPHPKVKVPHVPDLLKEAFAKEPHLKTFFDGLAPSHRREYVQYIDEAKREETKMRRLEKSLNLMRGGKDLMSKYRNC